MSLHQQRIGADRRVHQRFEDLRESLVELGGNNNGIVLNISEGGMAILSAEDLDVYSLRNLWFQAWEFEHWMEIAAEIAWISDSRKQAGIRFKGLSETARTQLRAGISIATMRVRLANQPKQAGAPAEGLGESFVAADSASESENISNELNSTSLAGKIDDGESLSHSDVSESAPDSRLPEAHQEIEAKEKAISSGELQQDSRTQSLNSPSAKLYDTKPQKNPLGEIRFTHLLPKSGVKLPSYARDGSIRISYGRWTGIAAITIAASLLAFLVGWILGDPALIKFGH